MSVMDDYGRYHANPAILRPACYPLQLEKVSEATVNRSLSECLAVGLLVLYDGGKHLYCPNFRQQTRFKSKFPEPTENNTLSERISERLANAKGVPTTPTPTPTPPTAHTTSPSPSPGVSDSPVEKCRCVDLESLVPDKRVGNASGNGALELINLLNGLYHRPSTHAWTYEEQHLCASIARRNGWEGEWNDLISFRKKLREKKFFPQSVMALLSGWSSHLDKARTAVRNPSLVGGL